MLRLNLKTAVLFVAGALLFFFTLAHFFDFNKFSSSFFGFSSKLRQVSLSAASSLFDSRSAQENKELKEKLAAASFLRASNKALRAELDELRKLMGYFEKEEGAILIRLKNSHIKPPAPILLASAKPGMRASAGDMVISKENFVFGELLTKERNGTVLIKLFGAEDGPAGAYLLEGDNEKIDIDLEAIYPLNYKFELNKLYKIKVGDSVYFKGYPLAQVYSINSDPQSPYNTVFVRAPFELDDLDYALIVPAP